MKKILHLKDAIDINAFQKIQDDISNVTEMSIITVDYMGKCATKHSRCSDFCKLMRANETYYQLCERCDSRGGLEAARLEKPYIYKCHKGLIDFATPIIVDGQYLGSVMAGQVLVEDDSNVDLENIVNTENNFDSLEKEEKEKLLEAYNKLPVVSFKRVQEVAQMMFHISNYIVEEAVSKMLQRELDEKKVKFAESEKMQAELEKEYKASQLKALQSQINPHFLFNVLNSISSLSIVENAPKTQEVIYNLSNMLRYTLKKANKIVSLEEEFDYINSYLNLQKVRFSDRLNYEVNIDKQFSNIRLPFMVIQTFVENSVVHGLETKEEGGYIKIFVEDADEYVMIHIEDNGTGIPREQLKLMQEELQIRDDNNLDKIGMNNANKRMAYYYGDEYKIEITSKIRIGTSVKITIKKEI
ncbi:histidine kinase [Clostridium botulinum]|uniref:Histidine kinase n=1 Tax=Clostridium botulinum TaxID=1491 RepID=A0A0M1LIG0_CLOBO|nr:MULTISPECIES: PocR ligand-binding domain-containing protein [Clostridium]KAI3349513.1 PocR ligand-binding domain-containing protein [Clostridium botulinum]KOM88587.1 histidine kinase [Clostridium botulinum]KOR57424.1 histidine kinase [Clostridium botulinum]MBN1035662.1 histidine kinase [Clostridium botulinum]MBN1042227.1 histidine kinase [Clostridium botulinum]